MSRPGENAVKVLVILSDWTAVGARSTAHPVVQPDSLNVFCIPEDWDEGSGVAVRRLIAIVNERLRGKA